MQLSKNYTPQDTESHWYNHWMNQGYFHSKPDERPAYTIVIPPPNVTGVLHMGHALNNSVQDVLIRHARLKGFNTCWVPGTDHASIATEAKVVAMLREQGIDKNSLSREEFLDYAWQWKEKYGGIILQQLKKLGCALDWNRTAFTMDPDYYQAVIDVFIDLYQKGYIYRGVKMINWDPKAKTALSDEEVIYKEVNSTLVYIKYYLDTGKPVDADTPYMTVATVRPETILGDTALCVHPDDERYRYLVGQYCFVPLINRRIPIITDTYIDMAFGTGCLKVTPAHDINDYQIGLKHQLPVIDTLNEDGTMSEAAQLYVGRDRFEVRKAIVDDLQMAGHIEKTEAYTNQVGFSERTDVVIEPRLSMQWWCKMTDMAKPALDAVMQQDIAFYPPKFKNTYRHWMENIKDWCISRQLRWGHRIPAWYDTEGRFVVAADAETANKVYKETYGDLQDITLTQDNDVLDTWFSSWLWPMEVFGWNKQRENAELNYYYPTATLVTAPEIIFFWVARMIMAGLAYKKQIPFKQVYFTGIVRDKQGRKMSKSLGNSPDLLKLIEDYGADAVRFGVLIASPAGNDLLFDENGCEQGRLFGNKIWNALKLVHLLREKPQTDDQAAGTLFPSQWFEQRLFDVQKQLEQDIREFKLSEGLKKIYSLIWDDFCSTYLEWIKPAPDQPMATHHSQMVWVFFESLMKMLHPFMPFITEEVYHRLQPRESGDDLMNQRLQEAPEPDSSLLEAGQMAIQIISSVRDLKVKQNLKPRDPIQLFFPVHAQTNLSKLEAILLRQCHAESIQYSNEKPGNAVSFMVGTLSCSFTSHQEIDTQSQREQWQKDLVYYQGFLQSVEKKLNNERFVQQAKPEVVAAEKRKQQDALEKIRLIEENLNLLTP